MTARLYNPLLFIPALFAWSLHANAAIFEVDSTSDSLLSACTAAAADCSLRGAITAANATAAEDTIRFSIPSTDSGFQAATQHWRIDVSSAALPAIAEALIIDGYSQAGAMPNTNTPLQGGSNAILKIELRNSTGSNAVNGIDGTSNNFNLPLVVRGLAIHSFQSQIQLGGGLAQRVEGCFLGTTIDGTQAEYVRIPWADTSLHRMPPGADAEAMVMLSDILPTGFECGVLSGHVQPGDTVVIVGAGPIGLAALLTARFFAPAAIIVIDRDPHRLALAGRLGATALIGIQQDNATARVMELTDGAGADVVIEAVGIPETFLLCQDLVAAGGHIANVGVHGTSVPLHLEKLWARNVTITTRLVDTVSTPMLMRALTEGRLDVAHFITHRFGLSAITEAYEKFGNAARDEVIKVIISSAE